MNVLSCKTPEMALKEIWVYLLAYNLIRLFMVQSAIANDMRPREVSFKNCLQMWLAWCRHVDTSDDSQLIILFDLMAQQRVGLRPGRIEPRAVKRRSKAYPLLTLPRPLARENVRKYGHPEKYLSWIQLPIFNKAQTIEKIERARSYDTTASLYISLLGARLQSLGIESLE